jgi:hypothetical protein
MDIPTLCAHCGATLQPQPVAKQDDIGLLGWGDETGEKARETPLVAWVYEWVCPKCQGTTTAIALAEQTPDLFPAVPIGQIAPDVLPDVLAEP